MFEAQQIYQSKIDITVGGSSISGFPVTFNIMSQNLSYEPVFWDTGTRDVALSGKKRSNIRGYDLYITLDYETSLEPDKIETILDGLVFAKNTNYAVRFYPDASDDTNSFRVIPSNGNSFLTDYEDTVQSGQVPTISLENETILTQVSGDGTSPVDDDVDAETLDGLDSTQFLRSDVSDTFTGNTLSLDADVYIYGDIFGLVAEPLSIRTDVSLNSYRIQDVANPIENSDVANKGYVDSAINGLDWQESVISWQDSPPASPSEGDRYLVASGQGDWSGQDDNVAIYEDGAWTFVSVDDGTTLEVEDVGLIYVYNGTSWVRFGSAISHNQLQDLDASDHLLNGVDTGLSFYDSSVDEFDTSSELTFDGTDFTAPNLNIGTTGHGFDSSGNVSAETGAIGLGSSESTLHVRSNNDLDILRVQRFSTADESVAGIMFGNSTVSEANSAYIGSKRRAGGSGRGTLVFATTSSGGVGGATPTEKMIIDADSGNLELLVGDYQIATTTVIDSSRNAFFEEGTFGGDLTAEANLNVTGTSYFGTNQYLRANPSKTRFEVHDSVGDKIAMGYLDGLAKNDGSGNWDSNHYGFWVKAGDRLTIDGDLEYTDGDWLVSGDATIKIQDGVNAYNIINLGTVNGEKGLFYFDGTASENIVAKFGFNSALIADWTVTTTAITSGNLQLLSTGKIWHTGSAWSLENDGSGYVANNNFRWDDVGNTYLEGNAQIAGTLTAGDANGVGNTFYAGRIRNNLLQQSVPLDASYWNAQETYNTTADYNNTGELTPFGEPSVRCTHNGTHTSGEAASIGVFDYDILGKFENNKTYVLSFWIKGNVESSGYSLGTSRIVLSTNGTSYDSNRVNLSFESHGLDKFNSNKTKWTRVWWKFTIPDSSTVDLSVNRYFVAKISNGINDSESGSLYTFHGSVQIEEGETPSAYQPTDGTILASDQGFGMWAVAGGFGGTMQNPAISLTNEGFKGGIIESTTYAYTSGNFSDDGTQFDLNNGNIYSEQFGIVGGSAYFKGNITGGQITGSNINLSGSLEIGTSQLQTESLIFGKTDGGLIEEYDGKFGLDFNANNYWKLVADYSGDGTTDPDWVEFKVGGSISNYLTVDTKAGTIDIDADTFNFTSDGFTLSDGGLDFTLETSYVAQSAVTWGSNFYVTALNTGGGFIDIYADSGVRLKQDDGAGSEQTPYQMDSSAHFFSLIDFIVSSDVVKLSSLPTSDPSNTGQLFTQTASQLGGSGSTKVLCVS